jgi:hypothetical protein
MRADLAIFNEAVKAWAERFQPVRVRRFAAIIGSSADSVTHTHYKSYEALAASYRKRNRRTISYNTVGNYVRMLGNAGVIHVEHRRWGPDDEYPNAIRNNLYTVRFDRVLIHGRVISHDFYGAIGLNLNVSSEGIGSGVGSGVGSGFGLGFGLGVGYGFRPDDLGKHDPKMH